MSRSRSMCLTQCSGSSVWPYIIVEVEGMPRLCAVRMTSIHCRTFNLLGLRDLRTSSSRISAAVPGILPNPASFNIDQILAQRQARFFDAVRDFHGRIGMHMKFRQASLDGAKKFNVIVAVEIFREAALNAHFRGPTLDRLERLGNQRIRGMKISFRRIRPSAEPAKSAADDANVGEIQISVHYVGDAVADRAPAKLVRDFHQSQQVVPFDLGQRQSLIEAQIVPGEDFFQGLGDVWARRRKGAIPGNFASIQAFTAFSMCSHSPRA